MDKLSVIFAGKCPWLDRVVTGGDRYMIEIDRVLRSRGATVSILREPAFPFCNRALIPAAVLWSFLLNGWYMAKRRDLSSSLVFEDYSSRTRLFISNRAIRGPRHPGVISLVQGFYHHLGKSPVMRSIETNLARSYISSLDLIIANSLSTAAEASKLGAPDDRIRVVHPGLDDVFMRMHPEPKQTMGQPARILFVGGQCKPVKGLKYLVAALGALKGRDFRVTIVGETGGGDFRGYVRRLKDACRELGLQDRVEFTGPLTPEGGLIGLYRNCDLFVLPSLWEGYGIAALEAMCFGLPVVASNAGGITEVVTQMETGILVPPCNPEALAGALAKLLDDCSLWREMSAAAAARALKIRRSWNAVGDECFAHLKEFWGRRAA